MRLGVMCSGNGTNFENIITNPICNKHEVVLMIHNTKQCGAVKRAFVKSLKTKTLNKKILGEFVELVV